MTQIDKSLYSIIKSPLFTEKAVNQSVNRKYAFVVRTDANKVEIKTAIEKLYKVKVDKVSSLIIKGKMKRLRANQPGMSVSWKKAIITLKEGFEIKLS